MKQLINSALKTAVLIIKLVIPFYLLADILIYFGILQKISFIFEPITSIMGLNPEVSLSIAAGVLFNLYAAIAFAAPLGLTPYEWTILGLFLGIAHALPVENTIMKKLSMPHWYSTVLRIGVGILAVLILRALPIHIEGKTLQKEISLPHYSSFWDMTGTSLYNASILALKIIILITIIIFIMHFIKTKIFKNKNLSASFSVITGIILGITYGAGILIAEKDKLTKKELLFVGTFLMIAHSLIEDPLLFVLFGANFWVLVGIRLILAVILSYIAVKFIKL
ncbi:nucleoside recognition protein [Nautilia sp. PV-1]|uniref:nucleoside recognition protein n=1 Tax=Nautilia sp. PV-1 TaxID=2579250 RepID=UPI000FDCB692|nr:nucleoside recognition protein [Nautilia sp. PV-1]AZV47427.1 nucleoside recognition protein [Nautilia sp. PV-1]